MQQILNSQKIFHQWKNFGYSVLYFSASVYLHIIHPALSVLDWSTNPKLVCSFGRLMMTSRIPLGASGNRWSSGPPMKDAPPCCWGWNCCGPPVEGGGIDSIEGILRRMLNTTSPYRTQHRWMYVVSSCYGDTVRNHETKKQRVEYH